MGSKKFLLVDDDERFTALLTQMLEKHAQCVVSNSVDDAILHFEHHLREQNPFQAVLMDIEMPKMNGHEVVEKMRKIEKQNKVNPLKIFKLIMITAHKDVQNVSKSFFKGHAEAYIHKENIAEELLQELKKINLI